jgi:putative nucleotidyltransferase with HDIG domain
MPKSLKLYIITVVALSAIALAAATVLIPPTSLIAIRWETAAPAEPTTSELLAGVAFWILITIVASALPVRMPRGTQVAVSITPIIAALTLGGPAIGGWVAAIGTTEMRELRGRIPWYGSLANHAGIVLPAVIAGVVQWQIARISPSSLPVSLSAVFMAGLLYLLLNVALASMLASLRTGQDPRAVFESTLKAVGFNSVALTPLAWLMAQAYLLAWWAAVLFALPLYTTRMAYARFVEMRDMFTQTIGALAEAVDKRDPFTSKHSHRVKQIAVDIGREMRVNEAELEALEWGGLLHDVGKIGVPDAVLLKQERLNREERMIMNAHPVLGAQIIAPVTKLAPELPIIRHHHEWYNGSGYPDRLIGDEIPKLARILHVADAFEAMTAARPYRMTPLTAEQALAELRKFAGIQFDPAVVDAFVQTSWVEGVSDPGRTVEPRPIPLIAQAANRMTSAEQKVTRTDPA